MEEKKRKTISKKEFIKRVSNCKAEYLKNVEAYFDALIECDFDKANKIGAILMTVLDPEVEAYMAIKSYELDSYDDLDEAYSKFMRDTKSFLN